MVIFHSYVSLPEGISCSICQLNDRGFSWLDGKIPQYVMFVMFAWSSMVSKLATSMHWKVVGQILAGQTTDVAEVPDFPGSCSIKWANRPTFFFLETRWKPSTNPPQKKSLGLSPRQAVAPRTASPAQRAATSTAGAPTPVANWDWQAPGPWPPGHRRRRWLGVSMIGIWYPHLVLQIIFLGVQPPKIILKIPDLIRFAHANPVCLRTQENNFGSKYVENFKIILETSGHRKVMFMGGEFTGTYMYVKPQEKNAPWLFEGVWFFAWL